MGFLNRQAFLLGNLVDDLFPSAKKAGAKIVISHSGDTDEFPPDSERRKHVRFPVCLAVRHGKEQPQIIQDFVLNASEGGAFIQCDAPYPPETILTLNFYVPPDERLLAKFSAEVTDISDGSEYAVGVHVKFFDYNDYDMDRFMSFLEEGQHLLDIKT